MTDSQVEPGAPSQEEIDLGRQLGTLHARYSEPEDEATYWQLAKPLMDRLRAISLARGLNLPRDSPSSESQPRLRITGQPPAAR